MSDSEDRRLEIAAVLDEALACRDELSKAEVPGAGSAAAHDLANLTAELTRSVNRQIALIDLWMVVATDQVHGLAVLIREGTTVFSPFPLIRSILEHSTAVVWVLGGEPNGRPARASLLALRGQEELAKRRPLGPPPRGLTVVTMMFHLPRASCRAVISPTRPPTFSTARSAILPSGVLRYRP